jgi:methionine synthase II (cobalamin-independent)
MQREADPEFHFLATGIGSVPFLDINGTCRHILETCPEMPYWPQFVRRTHLEDMIIQFSEGLPALTIKGKTLVLVQDQMEKELVAFYERFLAEDIGAFALSPEYAPGFSNLTRLIQQTPDQLGPYIKGQSVGPVTFAAAVRNQDGKLLFHYPDLLDACAKGLALRALWQVREMSKTGRRPVLFLDEPYLTGFGSAFTPVRREEVVALLGEVIEYLKQQTDVLVGIHCCGNTDWPMIAEAGPDIISFDAFSHMEHFLLFPEAISEFVKKGGAVAWGIVPTDGYTSAVTVEGLFAGLRNGLERLYRWGLDPMEVAARSLITPSCGMGTMEPAAAWRVQEMLPLLSRLCRGNQKAGISDQYKVNRNH